LVDFCARKCKDLRIESLPIRGVNEKQRVLSVFLASLLIVRACFSDVLWSCFVPENQFIIATSDGVVKFWITIDNVQARCARTR
jgi:hypothetical protein